jgi:hypothetical protein
VELVGGGAVEFEIAGQRHRIGAGLPQGLAVVAGLEQRQRIGLGFDRGRELDQKPPAFGRREPAPGALEGRACRGDGRIHVRGGAAGNRREGLAVDGREHVHDAPVGGRAVAPADDELIGGPRCAAGGPIVHSALLKR